MCFVRLLGLVSSLLLFIILLLMLVEMVIKIILVILFFSVWYFVYVVVCVLLMVMVGKLVSCFSVLINGKCSNLLRLCGFSVSKLLLWIILVEVMVICCVWVCNGEINVDKVLCKVFGVWLVGVGSLWWLWICLLVLISVVVSLVLLILIVSVVIVLFFLLLCCIIDKCV